MALRLTRGNWRPKAVQAMSEMIGDFRLEVSAMQHERVIPAVANRAFIMRILLRQSLAE
jgi:hypothetical protein